MAQTITPYQWAKNVGQEVLRFDTNTLPSPPPCVNKFLKDLINNCPINEYGDPSYVKLKKLISKYENTPEDTITVTNSGDEALDIIGKAFLNNGDYFLIQPPTYEIFKSQCEINRGKVIEVPLLKENFKSDIKNVIKVLKNTPVKITFVCNPNNPTGSITKLEEIELILKNTSGIVLVDEAYREFYGVSSVPLLSKYNNLVILRSFSKFGAMAGARVGYLLANKKLSQVFNAIRFPLGVSYFSCKLAEKLLEEDQNWIKDQTKMIKKERERLFQSIKKLGFFVYPSQANFILVNFGKKASDICEKLKENNILVRDRSNKKYLEGCVRITIRNQKQNNILVNSLKNIMNTKYDGLIFDMDGVLIDVSQSYREAIRQTASYFLKRNVQMSEVDQIKNMSGMNNDWEATYALINDSTISYESVKKYFQKKYLTGLINKEKLLISKKDLQRLKNKYKNLGIATGRPKKEAEYVIKNNKLEKIFDCIIALEDVTKSKPAPDSLLAVIKKLKLKRTVYIGDSPSDFLAAKLAKIPYINVDKTKTILQVINYLL